MESSPLFRLGIDCRFASKLVGLGTYTRELVTQLTQRTNFCQFHLFVQREDEPWLDCIPKHIERSILPVAHYSWGEQTILPRCIRDAAIDGLFSPHFSVPFFCPVPFVATIHDHILHRYPNQASLVRRMGYRALMHRIVTTAKHLIAVSHFTKSELAHVYGDKVSNKTTVIHEAVGEEYSPQSPTLEQAFREQYALHRPYILFVGNAKQHKNLPLLLASMAALGRPDIELVSLTEGRELQFLAIPAGVRILSQVPLAAMASFYSYAECFASPSLYEGFGLPVWEAAACACPAVVVRGSAMDEVAQPSTILVEPTISAFVTGLQSALRVGPGSRIAAIPRRWQQVADDTARILQQVFVP